MFILISLKTEVAKSVNGPKLQGPHGDNTIARLRAVNFGDLITADHKVLSDNCESLNNHRYAVVVQDSATQWIQAYPCKNKTSQETQRSLQKFLEPERKPKVIYTGNSLEFGKACEDLSWNHCTSTPHRSETNGIAERAVRRVKEGTSVLLQSGLNESWWADSMECYTYLRNIPDLLFDGKTPYERRFGQPFKDLFFHLVHWLSITLKLRRTSLESINLERKSYLDCSSDTHCTWEEFGRVTFWSQTLRSWRRWTHRKALQKDSMQEFYTILNFGLFWAALLKISGFYPTRFFRQFWTDPVFSAVWSTFLAEVNFHPTRHFSHFWPPPWSPFWSSEMSWHVNTWTFELLNTLDT